jgi:hypothetical protein
VSLGTFEGADMLEYETYDLGADWGKPCELTINYRDEWNSRPYVQGEVEYCQAVSGELRVGNWIINLSRNDLIKIAGPDRLGQLEIERAEQLNREYA